MSARTNLSHAPFLRAKINDTTNSTRKTPNNNWAIHAAVPAIPANPSNAARSAMIKNANDQLNIYNPFSLRVGLLGSMSLR